MTEKSVLSRNVSDNGRIGRFCDFVRSFPPGCGPNAGPGSGFGANDTGVVREGCENVSDNGRLTRLCDFVRSFPPGCGPNAGSGSGLSSGFGALKGGNSTGVVREGFGGKIRQKPYPDALKGSTSSAVIREGFGGKARALTGPESGKVRLYDPTTLKGPASTSGKVRSYDPTALKGPALTSGKVRLYDSSASKGPALIEDKEREKVLKMLEVFRKRCDELSRQGVKRVDIVSNRQLSQEGKIMKQPSLMFGSIPGVEIGDKFYYRIELVIVGLHRLFQGGIDAMEYGGERFATCIVANEGHLDKMGDSNLLCYIGEGGNLKRHEVGVPPDQELTGGNRALNNSRKSGRPVRVVRGLRYGVAKIVYVYDGLYQVSETVKKKGPQGNFVFEFRMTRESGQPPVPWKELRRVFH